MAYRPGFLTEWPWQRLGNFKYVVIAPAAVKAVQATVEVGWKGKKVWSEVDPAYLLLFPLLLLRMMHNQVWISLSRLQTARSPHLIVDRSLDFEQVDRERNWSAPNST